MTLKIKLSIIFYTKTMIFYTQPMISYTRTMILYILFYINKSSTMTFPYKNKVNHDFVYTKSSTLTFLYKQKCSQQRPFVYIKSQQP